MIQEAKEIIEAVYNINCDISERAEELKDELQYVYVESDSFTFRVKFLDCVIFNSDDDDREFNGFTDEYICSIEEHIRKCMLDAVNMVDHIRNVIISTGLKNGEE
jgi:hypothetical protein